MKMIEIKKYERFAGETREKNRLILQYDTIEQVKDASIYNRLEIKEAAGIVAYNTNIHTMTINRQPGTFKIKSIEFEHQLYTLTWLYTYREYTIDAA